MAVKLIAVAVGIALLRYMQAVPRSIGAALMIAGVVASVGGLVYFLQDQVRRRFRASHVRTEFSIMAEKCLAPAGFFAVPASVPSGICP